MRWFGKCACDRRQVGCMGQKRRSADVRNGAALLHRWKAVFNDRGKTGSILLKGKCIIRKKPKALSENNGTKQSGEKYTILHGDFRRFGLTANVNSGTIILFFPFHQKVPAHFFVRGVSLVATIVSDFAIPHRVPAGRCQPNINQLQINALRLSDIP